MRQEIYCPNYMYFDITNERNQNHRHREKERAREGEKIKIQRLYLYIMEIHNVCLCVFVQLKWICRGIKCHKIRIKGDNAICSSYRLVSWEHTCIHSSHSHLNTDCARIACLFVCSIFSAVHSFARSLVRSLLQSFTHSFIKRTNKFSNCTAQSAIPIQQQHVVQWFWYANVRTSKCKYALLPSNANRVFT